MKKTKKFTRRIFILTLCILSILFVYASYDLYIYLKAIQIETQNNIESQKEYVYHLAFKGQVIGKEYFKNSEPEKYRLRLDIKEISQKSSISNLPLPPYYDFENDSTLVILVSKKLFDKINIGDMLHKNSMSFDINRGHEKFEYLSSEKNKWNP